MSTFTLELKLNTSPADDRILTDRFFRGFRMYNRLVRHARKSLSGLRQDRRYRAVLKAYLGETDAGQKELLSDELSALRLEYGLSEFQFHSWIAVQQRKEKRSIDSFTAQKLASSAWAAVETVLFRKGKSVHFVKLMDFTSMEGKSNRSGMRFRSGKLRRGDWYVREALGHRVKYCRVVRRPMGTSWHFYLQLVLDGTPPQKHEFLEGGAVGIDPGVSTEVVVSEHGCILTELAPERPDIQKEVRRLQRRMDRSLRAANPGNYHKDGTPKRKKKWKKTKHYKKDQMRLKTLRRRNADTVKQAGEALADRILCKHGTDIHAEKMDYKALAARAKEDKTTKDGKHRTKKRFGASIAGHAPSRFLTILNRKLASIGKQVHLVNTRQFRASQLDHTTGEYTKVPLSSRWKTVGGYIVQRDLYSAFLLMHAAGMDGPDLEACSAFFETFLKLQDACIQELVNAGISRPSTFGF